METGGKGADGLGYYYGSVGKKGEDCGKIEIGNSLYIEAYGGAGGSGGGVTQTTMTHQSGAGGRRISRCGNWRPEVLGAVLVIHRHLGLGLVLVVRNLFFVKLVLLMVRHYQLSKIIGQE